MVASVMLGLSVRVGCRTLRLPPHTRFAGGDPWQAPPDPTGGTAGDHRSVDRPLRPFMIRVRAVAFATAELHHHQAHDQWLL